VAKCEGDIGAVRAGTMGEVGAPMEVKGCTEGCDVPVSAGVGCGGEFAVTSTGGEISGSLRQVVRGIDRRRVWGTGWCEGMVLDRFDGRIGCDCEDAMSPGLSENHSCGFGLFWFLLRWVVYWVRGSWCLVVSY